MAQARQADRALPATAIFLAAAAIAAVVLTAVISTGMLDLFGSQSPASRAGVSPAVLESGRQWELQRRAQSGVVDPVLESGRDWEDQRRQQGATE